MVIMTVSRRKRRSKGVGLCTVKGISGQNPSGGFSILSKVNRGMRMRAISVRPQIDGTGLDKPVCHGLQLIIRCDSEKSGGLSRSSHFPWLLKLDSFELRALPHFIELALSEEPRFQNLLAFLSCIFFHCHLLTPPGNVRGPPPILGETYRD